MKISYVCLLSLESYAGLNSFKPFISKLLMCDLDRFSNIQSHFNTILLHAVHTSHKIVLSMCMDMKKIQKLGGQNIVNIGIEVVILKKPHKQEVIGMVTNNIA